MDVLSPLLVATVSGASLWVVRRARARLADDAITRRLAAFGIDPPLDTRYLPPGLQSLVVDARMSRLTLETPLRRALEAGDHLRPWQLRSRLADFDNAMADARAALWRWLHNIAALGVAEFSLLRQLQLDPRPLRTLVFAPGIFDRDENPLTVPVLRARPDVELLTAELFAAMEHLRHFEVELLGYRPRAYR